MSKHSVGEKEAARRRKFVVQWLVVSLIYVSLGLGMMFLGGGSENADRLWRGAMLLGLLSMIYVQVRWFFRGDEFERAVDLKASGVGFVTLLVVSAAFSFLGPESGQVQHAGFVTLFLGFLSFSVARFKLVRGLGTA